MLNKEMSAGTNAEQSTNDETRLPSSPTSGNTNVVRSPNVTSIQNKDEYFNRPPKLFDEILMLCNGKSYREVSTALQEVQNIVLDKSILSYSVNRYTPQQK